MNTERRSRSRTRLAAAPQPNAQTLKHLEPLFGHIADGEGYQNCWCRLRLARRTSGAARAFRRERCQVHLRFRASDTERTVSLTKLPSDTVVRCRLLVAPKERTHCYALDFAGTPRNVAVFRSAAPSCRVERGAHGILGRTTESSVRWDIK